MQLSNGNKKRLKNVLEAESFDSLDEALDEVLSNYEDSKYVLKNKKELGK
jgi:hypothetical protein